MKLIERKINRYYTQAYELCSVSESIAKEIVDKTNIATAIAFYQTLRGAERACKH